MFYKCTNGHQIKQTCPAGTIFSTEFNVCEYIGKVECNSVHRSRKQGNDNNLVIPELPDLFQNRINNIDPNTGSIQFYYPPEARELQLDKKQYGSPARQQIGQNSGLGRNDHVKFVYQPPVTDYSAGKQVNNYHEPHVKTKEQPTYAGDSLSNKGTKYYMGFLLMPPMQYANVYGNGYQNGRYGDWRFYPKDNNYQNGFIYYDNGGYKAVGYQGWP